MFVVVAAMLHVRVVVLVVGAMVPVVVQLLVHLLLNADAYLLPHMMIVIHRPLIPLSFVHHRVNTAAVPCVIIMDMVIIAIIIIVNIVIIIMVIDHIHHHPRHHPHLRHDPIDLILILDHNHVPLFFIVTVIMIIIINNIVMSV
jgi:hypothetical protein